MWMTYLEYVVHGYLLCKLRRIRPTTDRNTTLAILKMFPISAVGSASMVNATKSILILCDIETIDVRLICWALEQTRSMDQGSSIEQNAMSTVDESKNFADDDDDDHLWPQKHDDPRPTNAAMIRLGIVMDTYGQPVRVTGKVPTLGTRGFSPVPVPQDLGHRPSGGLYYLLVCSNHIKQPQIQRPETQRCNHKATLSTLLLPGLHYWHGIKVPSQLRACDIDTTTSTMTTIPALSNFTLSTLAYLRPDYQLIYYLWYCALTAQYFGLLA
ncbi:hypothetical protein J3A83DRAFT_4193298 [Scleroderma citrinum]